jgi:hypothetical protein
MCLGFVKNYTGFVVVRAVLGITEGGLLPGIVSSSNSPNMIFFNRCSRCCIFLQCTRVARWRFVSDCSTLPLHSAVLSVAFWREDSRQLEMSEGKQSGLGSSLLKA